ncbi:hypothetical protein PV735_11225 [Streptomyces turgidiscabies]|uniref:Uncharacterized protein n=1 Tax=Streptomyces turgidiscabies (strain Car8) TaxID=698760 RepID=L7EWP5_STRT8|nr:hypothetical protein [Streptomyces turgidiscabies]ELP62815.1 hypothetical protein STRTUCAR8_06423 [Streptomyces turgidiscabies Car8]MDX3493255.1 hypothetical protein [Streptomyces turgidiscabies]GAQ70555.1 hypothetical protein T45_02291 [Streptomyces turgidiscabies]
MSKVTIDAETARHVLFHYARPGGWKPGRFTVLLMEAIDAADVVNKARLAPAYPELTAAMDIAANRPDGIARLQRIAGIPAPTATTN